MKKLLCLLITFVLIISNSVFATTYTDVEENSDLSSTISFLNRMGIINGYDDDTFRGDENVTRAEFAVMVARMLRFPEQIESSSVYYVDVPASHWAAGSIEQLTEQKYFSGKADGYFGINDIVTVEEAVTVFLRICGYEPLAEAMGGFPSGYKKVASDTKLTKGLQYKTDAISRKDMAVLIENALNLGMYSMKSLSELSGIGYKAGDDTILSEYWDMYHTEGIVTAANGTNLYGGSGAIDYISINDYTYKVDASEDYIDYLGTYVNAYFIEQDDRQSLYFIAKAERHNTITKIDYDEIVSVNENYTIKYYDGKKTKSEKLNNDVKVIYNGVCLPSYTLDVFEIDYGYIELIEIKSEGISVAKIWDYETCFVTSVDSTENYIYGENITGYIDLSDDVNVRFIKNQSKANVDFSDISIKNVLTVARYGDTVRAYLSEIAIDTAIESFDFAENKITAGGTDYSIVPCYMDTFSSKFKLDELKLYFDILGNVAYAEGKNESGDTFAYLIKGYIDSFEETIALKFFMQDGTVKEFFVSEKALIDGKKYKDAETRYNSLCKGQTIISQLVVIRLNENNEITYIDTPYQSDVENDYTLTENIPFGTYKFKWNGSIGGKGVMSDSTFIFVVPTDDEVKKSEYKNFSISRRSNYADNTGISLVSYKTSPKIGYEQVCVIKQNSNDGTLNDAVGCVVISDLKKAMNNDGELVTKIIGYTNGVRQEIFTTANSGIGTDSFKEGDVVRLSLNLFGEATSAFLEVSIDDFMDGKIPSWGPVNDGNFDVNYRKTFGVPYESEGDVLRVAFNIGDKWSEAYAMTGTYTLVDTKQHKDKVRACTIKDIHPYDIYGYGCDRIFIQGRASSITSVVVFR